MWRERLRAAGWDVQGPVGDGQESGSVPAAVGGRAPLPEPLFYFRPFRSSGIPHTPARESFWSMDVTLSLSGPKAFHDPHFLLDE